MKLIFILFTGLTLFSALYSPQVVYPVLIDTFSVETTKIALLQTATFLPLTLSPIFYGMLIDKLSPMIVLRMALLFLSLGEVLFAMSGSFELLLASRFFQGLFIPAAMTAVVSFISTTYPYDKVQRYISFYMASTMAGGVAGRVIAGYFSSVYGWRLSFMLLGAGIFICFILSLLLKAEPKPVSKELTGLASMIRNTEYMKPVLTVFFAFIVFSSIMNFYSIRIKELSPNINEFFIGFAYVGSLFGAFTAYMTPKFASFTNGYKHTIKLAFISMLAALLLFRIPSVSAVVATLFLFCGAFIVVHTSCSGLLNKYAKVNKGAVNGVYFTVYYFGGVIGSFLPGYIYDHAGWSSFLSVLMISAVIGLALAFTIRLEK